MVSVQVPVTEGKIPFEVKGAGKECFTWYEAFGDLSSGARPLIALHGGPGVGAYIPYYIRSAISDYLTQAIITSSACRISRANMGFR